MATCSVQSLMDDANCFSTLAAQSQIEAIKLTLLCQILQAIDPMATCDVQTLMTSAKCFLPAALGGMGRAMELQLLCEISTALGGGGSAPVLGLTNGAADPPLDGSVTTLFYHNTTSHVTFINTGTVAVPTWEPV